MGVCHSFRFSVFSWVVVQIFWFVSSFICVMFVSSFLCFPCSVFVLFSLSTLIVPDPPPRLVAPCPLVLVFHLVFVGLLYMFQMCPVSAFASPATFSLLLFYFVFVFASIVCRFWVPLLCVGLFSVLLLPTLPVVPAFRSRPCFST